MVLFYLLITTMPFMLHPFWARYAGGVTMTKYLGAACALYAVFYMTRRRTVPQYLAAAAAKWFVLFFALVVVSAVHGGAFSSKGQIVSYLSFATLFFVTLTVVDSARRLRWVLLVSIGSVAWASLYMIREWQKFIAIYGLSYRPGWVTGDPNYFAACAVVVLPLSMCFVVHSSRTVEKCYVLGCTALNLIALMISGSRGGFLGFMLAGAVYVWDSRRRSLIFAICVLALLSVIAVAPVTPLNRLIHPTYSDKASSDFRLQLWRAALRMTKANPLLGVGLDNFGKWTHYYGLDPKAEFHVAHNTYLNIAAEMGLPALAAFLVTLATSLRQLRKVRARAQKAGQTFVAEAARALCSGLTGFSLAAFFLSAQQNRFLWLSIFLACGLSGLASPHRRKAQEQSAQAKHYRGELAPEYATDILPFKGDGRPVQ